MDSLQLIGAVLEDASSIAGLEDEDRQLLEVERQGFTPRGTSSISQGHTSPLTQELYPSYTNFSLVPTTATRNDMGAFLLGGEEVKVTTVSNSSKQKQVANNKKRGPRRIFPNKLHHVLSDPSLSDVIAWMPHGRSWSILDSSAFVERVSKTYFSQNKLESFKRQARGWGFRLKRQGPDRGSYYHELFLRGRPHLAEYMETKKCRKSTLSSVGEPDLFRVSAMYPLHHLQVVTERVEVQEDDCKAEKEEAVAPTTSTFALVLSRIGPPLPTSNLPPCTTIYPKKPTTGDKRALIKCHQEDMQTKRLHLLNSNIWQPGIAIDKSGLTHITSAACAIGSTISPQHDTSSFQAATTPTAPPVPANGKHHENMRGAMTVPAGASSAELNCPPFHCDPEILKEEGEVSLSNLQGMREYVGHLIRTDARPENHIDGTTRITDIDNHMWAAPSHQQNISFDLSDLDSDLAIPQSYDEPWRR